MYLIFVLGFFHVLCGHVTGKLFLRYNSVFQCVILLSKLNRIIVYHQDRAHAQKNLFGSCFTGY